MKNVALITGGSRGIGYSIAMHLAQSGFDIAINGVREEGAVSEALQELRHAGADTIYCQGDVASNVDRDKILAKVHDHFGRLNVLVNNAGVAPHERKDVLETTEESFDRVMGINLRGPYFLTQAVARWLIEQKKSKAQFQASIITISSISATLASLNRGEYCISKAGLAMLTQLFAFRLGEYDIPVYEVRPGIIDTDMTAAVKEKYNRMFEQGLALQNRWGQPGDVGKAVAALAVGSIPYATGQVVMVDGGLTVQRL